MALPVSDDCRYAESHEYARAEGDGSVVQRLCRCSNYDMSLFELPDVGASSTGTMFGLGGVGQGGQVACPDHGNL